VDVKIVVGGDRTAPSGKISILNEKSIFCAQGNLFTFPNVSNTGIL
jgi:hypothetical protein